MLLLIWCYFNLLNQFNTCSYMHCSTNIIIETFATAIIHCFAQRIYAQYAHTQPKISVHMLMQCLADSHTKARATAPPHAAAS